MPEVKAPARTAKLTAADRCDSCGAQAYYRIVFLNVDKEGNPVNHDLCLCAHHFNAGREKIQSTAILIEDESWRLDEEN